MRLARAFLAMERSLTPLDGAPAHARGSGYPPDKGSNPVSRDATVDACEASVDVSGALLFLL